MMPVGMHSGGMGRMDSMGYAVKVEARSAHLQASLVFPRVAAGDQGPLTVEVRDSLGRPISSAVDAGHPNASPLAILAGTLMAGAMALMLLSGRP